MRRKLGFSLFEVVIAICLIGLAAGAIGWKIDKMISRKRFFSAVESLRSRLLTCRRLSLNMQADWRCNLRREEKKWIFESVCSENPRSQALPLISMAPFALYFNGEKKEFIAFEFFSSGNCSPKGVLTLQQEGAGQNESGIDLKIPQIFLGEEGNKTGPLHPFDFK